MASPRPVTDTGAGAWNRFRPRSNHSFPGTPVSAGGAPVKSVVHAASVIDGSTERTGPALTPWV